jgi:hypothetical protein
MSKQTAVQWLGYELNTTLFYDISPELWEQVNEIFKQALQMEREQIIRAANNGCKGMCMIDTSRDGNEYYNETYGGQDDN